MPNRSRPTTQVSLVSEDATRNPYPIFQELRRNSPVVWSEPHDAWFVMKYEDVVEVFRGDAYSADRLTHYVNLRFSAEERDVYKRTFKILSDWMAFQDPPSHTRLRGVVHATFTPRMVRQLRPDIEGIASKYLTEVRDLINSGEPIDFLDSCARPIASEVIAALLGVPSTDREFFAGLSERLAGVISGASARNDRHADAHEAVLGLQEYLQDMLDGEPKGRDGLSNGLLRELQDAKVQEARLSADEVTATGIMLIFAGHRTTACFLANALLTLMRHPDAYLSLRDAGEDSISSAVEEMLRYEGHTKATVRIAKETHSLHGVTVDAGERLYLVQASANRDEEVFDRPDMFDIHRSPNPHVAFGQGIHYCLGASLARLESQVVVEKLVHELPTLRLADEPVWEPAIVNRTLSALEVSRDDG